MAIMMLSVGLSLSITNIVVGLVFGVLIITARCPSAITIRKLENKKFITYGT